MSKTETQSALTPQLRLRFAATQHLALCEKFGPEGFKLDLPQDAVQEIISLLDRAERLDAENKALRARLEAPAAPLVDDEGCLSEELRELITGMTVSVDVSTGEHDASNRLFGEVTEVMEYDGGSDKHKVVLLVQEPTPNFTAAPAEDVAKGVRRYHFVQRSKFGPWTEVERQTAGSVAFVKEGDLSPQAAAKTGDAA
ncbi:hypothetical protein [Delftia acidovorans]|uniref:hypothetical protein n=1 Tax=Delftia acidovorans TaxID=80866 RepID=UPI002FDCAF94